MSDDRGSFFDLDTFWQPHSVTCPCGAVLRTDNKVIVRVFIEAHSGHHKEKKA